VDVIIVDTAHGHSQGVLDRVLWAKTSFPKLEVVGGNIVTGDAALALMDSGAGRGEGRRRSRFDLHHAIVAGRRRAAGHRGVDGRRALQDRIPLIADGGIRYSGDIGKAIVAGASSVMIGGLFAGTEEAPGEVRTVPGPQLQELSRHGLARARWRRGRRTATSRMPATPTSSCPKASKAACRIAGPLSGVVHQLAGGLRATMGYVGCATIEEMRKKPSLREGDRAGQRESHVHDVQITKEPPNYRRADADHEGRRRVSLLRSSASEKHMTDTIATTSTPTRSSSSTSARSTRS
jgi:IMP dehydrogenase